MDYIDKSKLAYALLKSGKSIYTVAEKLNIKRSNSHNVYMKYYICNALLDLINEKSWLFKNKLQMLDFFSMLDYDSWKIDFILKDFIHENKTLKYIEKYNDSIVRLINQHISYFANEEFIMFVDVFQRYINDDLIIDFFINQPMTEQQLVDILLTLNKGYLYKKIIFTSSLVKG